MRTAHMPKHAHLCFLLIYKSLRLFFYVLPEGLKVEGDNVVAQFGINNFMEANLMILLGQVFWGEKLRRFWIKSQHMQLSKMFCFVISFIHIVDRSCCRVPLKNAEKNIEPCYRFSNDGLLSFQRDTAEQPSQL